VVHHQHHLAGAHIVGFVATSAIGEVRAGIEEEPDADKRGQRREPYWTACSGGRSEFPAEPRETGDRDERAEANADPAAIDSRRFSENRGRLHEREAESDDEYCLDIFGDAIDEGEKCDEREHVSGRELFAGGATETGDHTCTTVRSPIMLLVEHILTSWESLRDTKR